MEPRLVVARCLALAACLFFIPLFVPGFIKDALLGPAALMAAIAVTILGSFAVCVFAAWEAYQQRRIEATELQFVEISSEGKQVGGGVTSNAVAAVARVPDSSEFSSPESEEEAAALQPPELRDRDNPMDKLSDGPNVYSSSGFSPPNEKGEDQQGDSIPAPAHRWTDRVG